MRGKGGVDKAVLRSETAPEGWHGSHGVLRREYEVLYL